MTKSGSILLISCFLAVTTSNDITDNSRVLKQTDEIPYFVYQGTQLTLDNSFANSRGFLVGNSRAGRFGAWLSAHSRLIQAFLQGQRGLKIQLALWRAKQSNDARPAAAPPVKSAETAKTPAEV